MDVSFRRTGGMFVLLRRKSALHDVVRLGDAVGDPGRNEVDAEFDRAVRKATLQSTPRIVLAELASLDGALVLSNKGEILAYGAILQPKKKGRITGTERSRSKAAIGASKYGLAVKISSDGDITVYVAGTRLITV
jgi:DNA integrity scanning protein DisA with diadenylate cyclase activity